MTHPGRLACIAALVSGCTTNATPVNTVLGERDLLSHIPEETRDRVSAEDHRHRFRVADSGAEIEVHLTTGSDPTGGAWVRNVRFILVANDGLEIHPPGVSGPLNRGTSDRPVASYAFHIAYFSKGWGRTTGGTVAGHLAGDGSFSID